jgi:hypothetical protein
LKHRNTERELETHRTVQHTEREQITIELQEQKREPKTHKTTKHKDRTENSLECTETQKERRCELRKHREECQRVTQKRPTDSQTEIQRTESG